MRCIITADLHLSDLPSAEYRWRVFPRLRHHIKAHAADVLLILGDVTHNKDNHSGELINRLVAELKLTADVCRAGVHILRGNHDYVDPEVPYLRFMDGWYDKKIHFWNAAELVKIEGQIVAMLPHVEKPPKQWGIDKSHVRKADLVCIHQLIKGSVLDAGHLADHGECSSSIFSACRGHVVAGDVHVPQRVGCVTYCGSPHYTSFGQPRETRYLLFDSRNRALTSIEDTSMLRKIVTYVTGPDDINDLALRAGDHVRVVLGTPTSDVKANAALEKIIVNALERCQVKIESVRFDVTSSVRDEHHKKLALTPDHVLRQYCGGRSYISSGLRKLGRSILTKCGS